MKHKADRVVAVGVPVAVLVLLRGNPVDDKVAAVVAVQPADDIEQRRFAGAARPQHGDEFVVAQVQAHIVERVLHKLAGLVLLVNILDLQHLVSPYLCIRDITFTF